MGKQFSYSVPKHIMLGTLCGIRIKKISYFHVKLSFTAEKYCVIARVCYMQVLCD